MTYFKVARPFWFFKLFCYFRDVTKDITLCTSFRMLCLGGMETVATKSAKGNLNEKRQIAVILKLSNAFATQLTELLKSGTSPPAIATCPLID